MVIQYLLLFLLFVVVVLGAISLLVYWDGKSAGMDSPIKWALFVFFTGPVGLKLYISEQDNRIHESNNMDPYSLPGLTQESSRNDRE